MTSDQPTSAAFEQLHPKVKRWIWQRGWAELHDIQEDGIRLILDSERDIIIGAPTAYGKTEAAYLPICSQLAAAPTAGIGSLYIGPLKALINDQFERLEQLCDDLRIPVHRWHGDITSARKKRVLTEPHGILLITPESLESVFVNHGTAIPRLFSNTTSVVVDELHAFIGNVRGRQLQSLLHRLEADAKRRVRRIGLSATLGDMGGAARFLRHDDPHGVEILQSAAECQTVRLQIRGYVSAGLSAPTTPTVNELGPDGGASEAGESIARHVFDAHRGSHNLIFCNRRQDVEIYADRLARMSEEERLPNEFVAHHGSIAKDLRLDVEERLKGSRLPVNAVCTSTLEMGIDIGRVAAIAQVGVPNSVASLRQRLGRSGRRGNPPVLRIYIAEPELTDTSPPQDLVRPAMVQAVAMTRLLIDRWYEPPEAGGLHLSTLVQQVLSLIAQFGGVSAQSAWTRLCRTGPFHDVDQSMFAHLLRSLGRSDILVQANDGTLLPGSLGERIVNHYSFYTAFTTPEEYRLVTGGKTLGTLPVTDPLVENSYLIFAARRWRVASVDLENKTVFVIPSRGGKAPRFAGGIGNVADTVRRTMRNILTELDAPAFLNETARRLLREARTNFIALGLAEADILERGGGSLLFPWRGDRIMNTLRMMLIQKGLDAAQDGVAIAVGKCKRAELVGCLREITGQRTPPAAELAKSVRNKVAEKYDRFLGEQLLCENYASRSLDPQGAMDAICETLAIEASGAATD